ncbi:MAG: hypothetical protein J0L84_00820 [Verrucomicrobia bacterium]|nr:hypothetical protein [Verrucomicrobiota bacterium]
MKATRSCSRRDDAGIPVESPSQVLEIGPPLSDPMLQGGDMTTALPEVMCPSRPEPRSGRRNRLNSQLDLNLPAPRAGARGPAIPPAGSRARAQWWFRQMRQIVAEGRDFDAAGVF